MKRIIEDLINLFFPKVCITCENRLFENEEYLCLSCIDNLPKTYYFSIPENPTEQLFAGKFPFVRVASYMFFIKQGELQKIIHHLKYKNQPQLGIWLGYLCGQDLKGTQFMNNIDYLVPVPLHKKREKSRGYNQSALIAQGLSQKVSIPVCDKILIRSKNNPSQTTKTKTERFKNVSDIFSLTDTTFFENMHILLIDDILTTGATLEECAKTILQTKNVKVSIFTLGSASL